MRFGDRIRKSLTLVFYLPHFGGLKMPSHDMQDLMRAESSRDPKKIQENPGSLQIDKVSMLVA